MAKRGCEGGKAGVKSASSLREAIKPFNCAEGGGAGVVLWATRRATSELHRLLPTILIITVWEDDGNQRLLRGGCSMEVTL